MNIDEDTCEWLGLPSPLEMYQQHCLLLENEIQELNLLLSKARADIFGLVSMLAEAQAKKDEFAGYLRLASQWLTLERLPIEEVAQRLGYTSQAAFSRAFKRITGKTPGLSRKVRQAAVG
ncbi:helix-turn-helix domain-containing protein [Pseudomonas sp. LF245]